MSDILFLPVKPKWADLIMSGKKTLELRKRLPTKGWGKRCVIYASSPRCEVVGTCAFVDCGRIVHLSEWHLENSRVTRDEFGAYFGNAVDRYAITLSDPTPFAKPIALETLRWRWRIDPPQQWRYIDAQTFAALVKAGQ